MPALCKRRGESRWRAQIKERGKIIVSKWFGTGPVGGPEYRKALLWEEERRKARAAQAEQPKPPEPTPTACLTVRDWANARLDEVKRRRMPATYTEARTAFKYLGKTFEPDLPLSAIKPPAALQHLNRQFDNRSGSAANRDRKVLACAWKWGQQFIAGFPLGMNPFQVVPSYPVNRKPRYVPAEEDFWKVVSILEGQDRVLLLAFLHLAARRGELFRLTWADVDFAGLRVQLTTHKTSDGNAKSTWLPMTSELKRTLLWWWENRRHKHSPYVFTVTGDHRFENQHEGKPYTERRHFMKKACERARVKPFGFHAIRHLSATILYHAGYNLSVIQAILRHESATTTAVYLKRLGHNPDHLKKAVQVFENRRPGKVVPFINSTTKEALGWRRAEG